MPDILTVSDLVVEYRTRGLRKPPFRAVDGVSFTVPKGSIVALVGESGSGKTTIGRAILGLAPVTSGAIDFDGHDVVRIRKPARRKLAKDLQVIFQDPIGSLNPARTVASTIFEPMRVHGTLSGKETRSRIAELLERVNLPRNAGSRYPGQFSGGQRQRIAIARALAIGPRLVICDEPTSALDVSTQARVLELLGELRRDLSLSYLFITHDLAVVREFCDYVVVLRHGKVIERGTPDEICDHPKDPYVQRLVAAAPVPHPALQAERRAARQALAKEALL